MIVLADCLNEPFKIRIAQWKGASGRCLVIDDSKTIRRRAENLLAREGCDVITATDGFDAGQGANARPEIILVDIMMSRLDGYQTSVD